jgi:uncharacterized surface protein with fasciclin (FAS1) repeats
MNKKEFSLAIIMVLAVTPFIIAMGTNSFKDTTDSSQQVNEEVEMAEGETISLTPELGDLIDAQEGISLFAEMLKKSGLIEELQGLGELTFFIPSDLKLESMISEGTVTLQDSDDLIAFVKGHIIAGKVTEAGEYTTINDNPVVISHSENGMLVFGDITTMGSYSPLGDSILFYTLL